jgi:uncharacterized protein YigA (DUF484 family)
MDFIAKLIVSAVFDYLRKNPEVLRDFAQSIAEEVIEALPKIVDQMTNLTPWQLDDQMIDKLAKAVVNRIPGMGSIIGGLGGFTGR